MPVSSVPKEQIINEFKGKYSFLSNFYILKTPIIYEGLEFLSSEHAYQAAKTVDLKLRNVIQHCNSPGEAKRIASDSEKTKLRLNWERIKSVVMYDILLIKFRSNPQLAKMLYFLHGYHLCEGNWWHDNFWGDCYCKKCKDIVGHNILGRMLMRLTDRFCFFKDINEIINGENKNA